MPDIEMKLISLGNLSAFANELKVKYARQSALEALQNKVNELVNAGGEPNKLEGVKINDVALTIAEKMVNILVATGDTNGTFKINNAEIAIAGLQALAFKAQVSESDLDAALKTVLDAKATGTEVESLRGRMTTAEGNINTLKGDAATEGSVKYEIAQAFAALTGNDTEIKSLQALVDWVDEHAQDALELSNQVTTNKNDIKGLQDLIGALPEGVTSTTVVGYIAEAIAGIGIGDYAKTTEVTQAINTALENFYTKGQIDAKFADYSTTVQMNAAIQVVDDKLVDYAKSADVESTYVKQASIKAVTDSEVTALLAD